MHVDLGIVNAIEYQEAIGLKRKEASASNTCSSTGRSSCATIRGSSSIRRLTSTGTAQSAMSTSRAGISRELADTLMQDYRIFTVGINRPGVVGLRITPNVYTTLEELDALVSAIKALSA